MFTTDIAVRVNHPHPTLDSLGPADGTSGDLLLQVMQAHIMGAVRQSSCRVINIRGAHNPEMNRILAIVAAQAGWTVLAPKRPAAPLERLIFGAGFRITESAIAQLAAHTTTIVIDKFDRIKSKRAVLSACRSASCQSVLITSGGISDAQFSDAGISRYLCIDLSSGEAPPDSREVVIDQ